MTGSADEPSRTIPFDRLPPGFAETVDDPPEEPARPRPAATVALLRDGPGGPEALLLRRVRSSGFVPGAWVFPGGRVDGDDAGPALLDRLDGLTRERAARRLGLEPSGEPPAVAYYIAAIREAFEETGILVGRRREGGTAPSAATDPAVRTLRGALLEDEGAFPAILDRMDCRMDGGAMAYIAHWITPVAEPRRYDTRFFAAVVGEDQKELVNERELTHALWLTPERALARHREGKLPMVFPTVRTLEDLRGFASADEVLESFRSREIPTILPRLVRTATGVGIEVG